MNIFVIWLVMVTAWNFGYPQASPLEDVIVAVIAAEIVMFLLPLDHFPLDFHLALAYRLFQSPV